MLTSVHDFDLSEQRINLQTENPPLHAVLSDPHVLCSETWGEIQSH